MSGFSAAESKATCGRKYKLRNDAVYSTQVSVGKAADAALARRGLKRKGRVSPKESMQMAQFGKMAMQHFGEMTGTRLRRHH